MVLARLDERGQYCGMIVYSKGQWANAWDSPMRRSYLKQWLRNHGIPETKSLDALDETELEGLQASVRVRGGLVVSVRPLAGYTVE